MAIPTALLAKVLAGLGAVATAATVISVTANRPKDGDTKEQSTGKSKPKAAKPQPPSPEETLKALNEKIKDLGIEGCEFAEGETKKENCTLDKEKIGKVKFDGKTGTGLTPESASLTLKIEKGYEGFVISTKSTDLHFPEGLRFSFTNSSTNDITIGNGTNPITFKSNTTYDYKIKTEKDKDDTLAKAWNLNDLLNKVSLKCTNNTVNECSLEKGNVNVWKNENDYFTGGGTNSPPGSSPQKKIKVARDSAGYRQGIKFYVEEEITLKISSGFTLKDYPLNKETSYEIDIREVEEFKSKGSQRVKKWFLVDKTNEDLNKKIEGLGISDCKLENGATKTSECELDETKVKVIKFSNKQESSDLTVSGLEQSKKLVLVIERDYKNDEFPSGLRFTFTNKNTGEVTIGENSDSNKITLKSNTSYDFKIKTEGNNETKLEKAWTLTSLAAKVGLACDSDTVSECSLKTEGINVWKDETDYITGAAQADSSKKMTVTKESSGYPEGFKFTVKDGEDITLTGGTKKKTNGISKLTSSDKSYEISPKNVSGAKKWFLIEKTDT